MLDVVLDLDIRPEDALDHDRVGLEGAVGIARTPSLRLRICFEVEDPSREGSKSRSRRVYVQY